MVDPEFLVDLFKEQPSLAVDFRHIVKVRLSQQIEGTPGHDSLLQILENLDHYLATL